MRREFLEKGIADPILRKAALGAVLSASLFMTSCSGVLVPVHAPDSVSPPAFMAVDDSFAGNLPQSIKYANDWRAELYQSVDNQTKVRSGLALTLIPLTATLVYLGINGSTTELFSGLSIGGATAYTASTLFVDGVRDRINMAGAKALTCAVASVGPMLVTKGEHESFTTNLYGTASAPGLTSRIVSLEGKLASVGVAAAVQKRDAQAAIAFARTAREAGFALDGDLNRAASELVTTVDGIVNQVNTQIVARLPDPTQILSAARSINSAGLSPLGSFTPPQQDDDSRGGTQGGIGFLLLPAVDPGGVSAAIESETAELRQAAEAVNRFVEIVNARRAKVGSRDACTVDQVDTNFSVTPATTEVTLTPGTPFEFSVQSEGGIPTAQIVGNRPAGLNVDIGVAGGSYTVTVDPVQGTVAEGATATLLIAEAKGPGKALVKLVVPGNKPAETNALTGGPFACSNIAQVDETLALAPQTPLEQELVSAGDPDGPEKERKKKNVRALQTAIGLTGTAVDGTIGKTTRSRLCTWLTANAKDIANPVAVFTEPVVQLLGVTLEQPPAAATVAPAGPQSTFEDALAANEAAVTEIQASLGVTQSGKIDAATRSAVAAHLKTIGLPIADLESTWPEGLLSKQLVESIVATPSAALAEILAAASDGDYAPRGN